MTHMNLIGGGSPPSSMWGRRGDRGIYFGLVSGRPHSKDARMKTLDRLDHEEARQALGSRGERA